MKAVSLSRCVFVYPSERDVGAYRDREWYDTYSAESRLTARLEVKPSPLARPFQGQIAGSSYHRGTLFAIRSDSILDNTRA